MGRRRPGRRAAHPPEEVGGVSRRPGTLVARVLPPSLTGGRRAALLVERNLMVYRRTWIIIVSGFFEPLFYLLSIGVGIGALVGDVTGAGGRVVSYTTWVAPGLLASAAMNGAVYESTMNIFFKLKYAKTYDAVLSTPMGVGDVAVGEITWALMRGAAYAVAFLVVMLAMGLVESWWAVLVVPGALLIGFAFAAVGMACTSFMRSWNDFDMVQLAVLPLFLFSATFYPLSVYPSGLQVLVRVTPLYHGVALLRGLSLGDVGPGLLVNVAYLAVMGTVGLAVTSRRLARLLLA
ncbi:MAG: ABC transporter permease [Acidimicrobiia bacterium]|nr:ABC transporter permease [Acidimicrobiia bacterium]